VSLMIFDVMIFSWFWIKWRRIFRNTRLCWYWIRCRL